MFIAQSFIKELLERVDIYDTINRRITLKTKGDNGWACCPFHNEKTSSFSVSRQKQFYHCFGCGEHGNAISFLMKYEGLDFAGAVEKLAMENGMQVRYEGNQGKRNPEIPRLVDLMKKAQDYYQKKLKSNSEALKYITDRGLTPETIDKFALGYAPEGWRNLSEVFDKSFSSLLIEAGLQREGKNNNDSYDFFRNRLMFPIRNTRGQTIAFSARTMTGEEPKYINTGETPIFKKGSEVFGLYEGQRYIREKNRAIVVEGQMDVIQLSQAGFQEACAPLGTAIRSEHIEKLLKLTDHIIFSFDGDKAGHKAARRSLELVLPLLGSGQKASFLFLPDGEDPDSYVKNYGAQAFEKYIESAQPLSNYLITNLSNGLNLSTPEDKSEFLSTVAPLLRSVKDVVYKTTLLANIAKTTGFENERALAKALNISLPEEAQVAKKVFASWKNRATNPNSLIFTKRRVAPDKDILLSKVLRNFLLYPQLAVEFERTATEIFLTLENEMAQAILELLSIVFKEGEDGYTMQESLIAIADPTQPEFEEKVEEARTLLLSLSAQEKNYELFLSEISAGRELQTDFYAAQKEVQNVFYQLELEHIENEKKKLLAAGVNTEEDKERFSTLFSKANELKKAIRNLHKEIGSYLKF